LWPYKTSNENKSPALSESSEKELILIFFIYRYKKGPALAGFTDFRSFVPAPSINNGQVTPP
jgi:hypothetical protein